MADLVFFTGAMDSGKSTLALQLDHTQRDGGRAGLLLTAGDRGGPAVITSRLGLSASAMEVEPDTDLWHEVVERLTAGERIDYLIADEAQFYTPAHIDQLARIADELDLDVYAFGILTDFRTHLFPGSQRLVELCDRIETLQVQPLCWCGELATHNARIHNGRMVLDGDQVLIGDSAPASDSTPATTEDAVVYETLCRRHHRRRVTRARARATLSPEPLPFSFQPVTEEE